MKSKTKFGWLGLLTLLSLALTAQAGTLEKSRVLDVRGLGNLVDGPSGRQRISILSTSTYEQLQAMIKAIVDQHPQQASIAVYGKTVEGRDLTMIRIAHAGARRAPGGEIPAVEISGAIHGNEYLGIEDKLIAQFLEHEDQMPGLHAFLEKGGVVYFIPVVNPDGYAHDQRLNHNGADLNRDFDLIPTGDHRFTQPESRLLADAIDHDLAADGAKLKLSLDYHCCVPAFIMPWAYIDAQPDPKDVPAFTDLANLESSLLGYNYGNALHTVGYLAEGSTIDYYYAKYGTLGLTIEGNWDGELPQLAKHIAYWDRIFQGLADTP